MNRRRLRIERLESRQLLARAAVIEHQFREDDFSITGGFDYRLREPAEFDYIDTISNGQFRSTKGHVRWTSPKDGRGSFEGIATGDGRDTVEFAGRRPCSQYGIEEIGEYRFDLDASINSLKVTGAFPDSSRYTYYQDLTGGYCPQPNPPWARFFAGRNSGFTGTFDPGQQTFELHYVWANPETAVNVPPATVQWAGSAANDLVLSAKPFFGDLSIPDDWIPVGQSMERPADVDVVDVRNGGVEVMVTVQGGPIPTSNVLVPVATIRLYWASEPGDTEGAEITLDPDSPLAGVYWNNSQVRAVFDQLPSPPADAHYLRISVAAPPSTDGNVANSERYLKIGQFAAGDGQSGPINEDESLDGTSSSLLSAADVADPGVRVLAYQYTTALGGNLTVYDDRGSFTYTPSDTSPAIQALAPGESIEDTLYFLAIKDQIFIDEAINKLTILGVNDPPFADFDQAATTNFQRLTVLPSTLLANDYDVDHNDQIKLDSVTETTTYGASVQVNWNDQHTAIVDVVYDPTTSAWLRQLGQGEIVEDYFDYQIVDKYGEVGYGSMLVTVTGEEPRLLMDPVPLQTTIVDLATAPISLYVVGPTGDGSDIQLTAQAEDPQLAPASGMQFDGEGNYRSLIITPGAGLSGRTHVQVTAKDGAGRMTMVRFPLVVGTAVDGDLDGAPNDEEDAAPNGGDMNGDGVLDSHQPDVTSRRSFAGSGYLNLQVTSGQLLANVVPMTAPAPQGVAGNASFPLGSLHYEVIASAANETAAITIRAFDSIMALNRYFEVDRQGATPQWRLAMRDRVQGARIYTDWIELVVQNGGTGDQAPGDVDRIVGEAALAHVAFPWQNVIREDVDHDGHVVPRDILILLNQLNSSGPRQLGEMPQYGDVLPYFLDPSGNNSLEPFDVLVVVNYLIRQAGNSEGEFAPALPPLVVFNLSGSAAPLPESVRSTPEVRALNLSGPYPPFPDLLGDGRRTDPVERRFASDAADAAWSELTDAPWWGEDA